MDTIGRPKWVSNSVLCPAKTSSFTSKMVCSNASRSCKIGDLETGSRIIASEACDRRGNRVTSKKRLLQPHISGAEKVRRLETCDRPFSTQQVCSLSPFQNGDIEFNQASTSERRLGNFLRPERCVLSCTHSSTVSSLSSICVRREGIPISSLSLRAFGEPVCVYSRIESSFESHTSPRYSSPCLPGRLASTFSVRGSIMATQQKASGSYPRLRLGSQLGQIRTNSSSGFPFPRSSIQAQVSIDRPLSGQYCVSSTINSQVVGSQSGFSPSGVLYSWSDGVYGQSLTTGESAQESSSVGIQEEMESGHGSVGPEDSPGSLVCQSSQSMVGYEVFDFHVPSSSSYSTAPSVYRFQFGGVGCSHGQPHGLGLLDQGIQRHAHQCPGNEGSLVSFAGICSSHQGPFSSSSYRQYDSSSLCQQTGGDSLSDTVQSSSRDRTVVFTEQGSPQGQVFAWTAERFGGLSEQERKHCSNRMVPQSESSSSHFPDLGHSTSGSVCNTPEQEVVAVCVSSSGSRSVCCGRTESQLAGNVGICFSSVSSDSALPPENSRRGMLSVSHCSSVGKPSMVSSSALSSGGSCSLPSAEERPLVSASVQNVSSHSTSVPSSRLVAMQQRMQASGISESVARRIYSARRPSTNSLYDYRWKSWVDWCFGRKVDPFNPSVNFFGEFLISLHDKNFSPATVKGYRSAIATTLKQVSDIDFSNQSILSDVVRSFELERPRIKTHFPKWDLAVVLSALTTSPFEPLETCGFKEMTFKTVFLIALASGRRRSEIHALSYSDVHFSDHSVTLSTFPGFLAKNQLPSVLSSPISLPSLQGQDMDPLLCPVRALKIYLGRVSSRRRGRKRLFISHLESFEKEISCDSISRWIVQTIRLAYSASKLDQVPVNAHEVRALASSWAWSNKVPLEDVVKAGFWSTENSFIRFYLRDTSVLASSLARLGPVVAAQKVIVPVTSCMS